MKNTSITRVALAAVAALTVTACGEADIPATRDSEQPSAPADSAPGAPGEPQTDQPSEPAPSSDAPQETTEPADSPEPSDEETLEDASGDEPQESYPPQEEQSFHGDKKFDFKYFSVEVLQPEQSPEKIDGVSGIYARTCLHTLPDEYADKGTVPISANAWRHEYIPSGTELERMSSGGYEPAYPEQAKLAVGECAEGYLSFEEIDEEIDGILVYYENSFGARARWTSD